MATHAQHSRARYGARFRRSRGRYSRMRRGFRTYSCSDHDSTTPVWVVLQTNPSGAATVMALCTSKERADDFAAEWISDLRTCPEDEGWYVEAHELDVLVPLC